MRQRLPQLAVFVHTAGSEVSSSVVVTRSEIHLHTTARPSTKLMKQSVDILAMLDLHDVSGLFRTVHMRLVLWFFWYNNV